MAPRVRAEVPSKGFMTIRVSPREQAMLRTAARVNRQPVTGFIRDTALAEAGDCIDDRPVTAFVLRNR